MNKKFIITLFLVALATSVPAQITRIQADAIVKEYLQRELGQCGTLYVHTHLPHEGGITITTSNGEIFTAKYACWTYYLGENESAQCRYLFVKEDNGNLLEVIANNDNGYADTNQWAPIETTGLPERKESIVSLFYPNPTTGQFSIENGELSIVNVEIFDMMGKMQKIESVKQNGEVIIDISHFSIGVYFVRVQTQKGIITQKIIKN